MSNTDFINTDPFDIDGLLSDDEKLIDNTAKQYAKKQLAPRIVEDFYNHHFDKAIMLEMGNVGLLGITSSEKYGGSGASHIAYGLAARAVEAVDSAYRSAMSVQSSLVIYPIESFASDEMKDKYLPSLISGEKIGCFGLTEVDGGSDPGAMRTSAIAVDDGYILNGEKMWITNSPLADVAVVWAKLDGDIRGFIVQRGMDGFLTPEIPGKLSLCASITGQIVLNNCHVPKSAIFPNVKGLKGPFSCLNKARYGIAWGALGAAEFCWQSALNYAQQRMLFGKPLAATQLVQMKFANMQTEIGLGLLACLRLGQRLDHGQHVPELISLLKRNNCQKSLDICRQARDILGGNGIMGEYEIMRHVMNLETVNTYEGTADVHALILGRSQTGHAAF